MLDSLRIRTKLVVAVVIPLLALIGLSVVVTSTSNDRAEEADAAAAAIEDQVALATSSLGPGGLITALQEERNGESLELVGLIEITGRAGPAELRPLTDAAIETFNARIAASPAAVQAGYAPAIAALDEVVDQRAQNDLYAGPRTTTGAAEVNDASFLRYSSVIQELFDANSAVATAVNDPELRAGAVFFDSYARQTEAETRAVHIVSSQLFAPSDGGLLGDPLALGAGSGFAAIADELADQMLRAPHPEYRELAEVFFAHPSRDVFDTLIDTAFTTGAVDASVFSSPALAESGAIGVQVQSEAAELLTARADDLATAARQEADDAARQAQLVTWLMLGVLALALLVTIVVSRSITKPLARLVSDADDMATNRLPGTVRDILDAPLGVDVAMPDLAEVSTAGGQEIAEVAAALNSVQASAADLAVEQAVLRRNISDSFVNLGRRNQNLLTRQLEQITEMEHQATDDDLQQLFVLDHLATRMRRNAESLLLLAGLEPHRQWAAPVALVDVLRGALGEVEDYDRVTIKRLDEAVVTGSQAADITHLIAELLENALNFSPPGRGVEIVGGTTPNGYSLAIIDYGVGMDAEALETANLRLSGGESFTVAPSRYLGHYVVGIQARRLGVRVQLQESPSGGITALLDITAVIDGDGSAEATPAAVATQVAASTVAATPTPAPVADVPPAGAAAHAPAPAGSGAVETTPSGYAKRVRGANVPRTDVLLARADTTASPTIETPSGSTAESMRSMLSGLQAGTERAQDEMRAPSTDDTEERR